MTDATWLYAILILIYVTECFGWTSKHTVLFYDWIGSAKHPSRFWTWGLPGKWFGNEQYGLHLRPGLPPLGNVFHCPVLPASLSPAAALAWVPFAMGSNVRPDQSAKLVLWNEATSSTKVDGKVVSLNDEPLLYCATPAHAQHVGRLITSLTIARDAPSREATIDAAWRAAFDQAAIRANLDRYASETFHLRIVVNVLFAVLFIIAPLLVLRFGISNVGLPLFGLLFVLMVAAAIVFRRTHQRLHPRLTGERWKHTAMVLLSPPAAVRSLDALARDNLAGFHPLAVAQVIFPHERFLEFARTYLLDFRYSMPSDLQAASASRVTLQWHMRREALHIRQFLDSLEVAVDDLTVADPPADEDCKSYCPRCQCQFVIPEGRCTLCDLPLVAFA